ncbi:MAG: FliA/WhiG family RNA polymerase sigma factor [Alphaproteobacteria bacterium]|nr:FliA/WhiG family RNA polymerase sigma factor [Alphaproteobacteria bacterium]MCB9698004.1 FliA/WhiG family RNA polymerase sigma factor [Alphaproteobacteria bacterium]
MSTDAVPVSNMALVAEHYPLACAIARRTHARLPKGVDLDDLIGTAVMGLIEAVERYDPSRGVCFRSYAKHRIQGSILDSLRATDWVPRAVRRRAQALEQARSSLSERLGRAPTLAELAEHLGTDTDGAHAFVANSDTRPLLSLDAPTDDGTGAPLADLVAADGTPEERAERAELRRITLSAIERLPEREKVSIVLFYFHELSLKEVGEVLGVTESRACQLNGQGIVRLRQWLRGTAA